MTWEAHRVLDRLENTGKKWWGVSLGTGLVLAASISLFLLTLFILADALLYLPQAVLGVFFVVWIAATGLVFWRWMAILHRNLLDLPAVARRVELACPELGSHLINLVQLGQLPDAEETAFSQAAVHQAMESVGATRFDQAAERETRWNRLRKCMLTPRDLLEASGVLVGLLALIGLLSWIVPAWGSATSRFLQPWRFVPAVGSVKIQKVTPGDTSVLLGKSLEISAEVENPESKPLQATLYVRRDQEKETSLPMMPDESQTRFVVSIPQILSPLQYRLAIGDSQSVRYQVSIREKPSVTGVEVTYHFPDYMGKSQQTLTQKHADLEAPQFTVAGLKVQSSTPIVSGHVLIDGRKIPGQAIEDGRFLLAYVLLNQSTNFTLHLFDDAGLTDPDPRVNQVKVQLDTPPVVQLLEPARERQAAPGSKLPIAVKAEDDHGLGQVRLELRTEEGQPASVLHQWTQFGTGNAAYLRQELTLDPQKFKPGQPLFLRAVAVDQRKIDIDRMGVKLKLDPQETSTAWHVVHLISPEAQSQAAMSQLDALRAAIFKILQVQLKARVMATGLVKPADLEALKRLGQELRQAQIEIQKSTVQTTDSVPATAPQDVLVLKRAMQQLAAGDMIEAVRQAEAVAALTILTESPKAGGKLTATQDRVIDVLRRLLNELRKETAELLAEMPKRAGGDLPDDVKDKLRDLKDKLGEFLKQQKKVIEATENLAKTPVEDFSEKDDQLLKKLAATEDEWSKFLKDKHTDLSKLPEQSLSNPSLLKELVEVQTQIKMAEDALTKKAADIAVPLEQLGAEMAKEMTTNIEKWLPDTPDRERWSQEEPLSDDMKKAPLAELPKELEDIVGELMEQEKDLLEELEDASSSWADSLDKGAGWDAMDGPISNNSARGVTGNRLPNTSEIDGRSGEGRQGQSSGEFVGDTAVGKGGRNTPSRLTPDAFVKGQVKDVSKDPVGGATGGGKESGAGGAGLEGPLANRPQRQMERLANKQAELRNKAESIDLKFKVMNHHKTDLSKLLAQMQQIEDDLRSGRYQNALRRREVVLEGLGQVKMYLRGEFTIRQDQSPNVPAGIQKDILGSMGEPSPAGWEKLNRQYFEQLTNGGKTETPPAKKE